MRSLVLLAALLGALALPSLLLAAEPADPALPASAPSAATGAASPESSAPQQPGSEQLEDGMTLTVAPLPGARWSSLRFVVKAGSRQDPVGKEGLAHLVQHLIFQRIPEREPLLADLRAAGATIDAQLSTESTTFLLDAPSEHFAGLAARFIALVTDPSLELSLLERENGLVAAELHDHTDAEALTGYLEDALFTQDDRPLGGTAESRAAIGLKDVIEFFNRYYASQNMAVVFAGPLGFEEARALVARSVRIPPTVPEELARLRPRMALPSLPHSQKLRAPLAMEVHGYLLDEQDAPACEGLADLLGLRFILATQSNGPLSASPSVRCVRLHGNQFLFAFARTGSLDAGRLARLLDSVFAKARRLKLSAREKQLLARRETHRDWRGAGPAAVAGRLADEAVRGAPAVLPEGEIALEPAAARTFVESRELRFSFSPFDR